MTFYCIADEDTVRGFRLAGVAGAAVTTPEEIARAVAAAASDPACGIMILTQPCAAMIRPLVEQFRLERETPIIVEIPGPAGPLPGHPTLWRLLQEAVGCALPLAGGKEPYDDTR